MKKLVLLVAFLAVMVGACAPAAQPTAVPPTMAPQPTTVPPAAAAPLKIAEVAAADGRFSTLLAAVQAAGLADTLNSDGPFTVFAPTDEAFAKLPAGTVDALLKDPAKLKDILLYHVVAGKVMAADVVKLSSAKTVEGSDVAIKVDGGKVMLNDATVVITDIPASNGVIHVIDSVILPPGM